MHFDRKLVVGSLGGKFVANESFFSRYDGLVHVLASQSKKDTEWGSIAYIVLFYLILTFWFSVVH